MSHQEDERRFLLAKLSDALVKMPETDTCWDCGVEIQKDQPVREVFERETGFTYFVCPTAQECIARKENNANG